MCLKGLSRPSECKPIWKLPKAIMGSLLGSMRETPSWGQRFMGRCRRLKSPSETPCTLGSRRDSAVDGSRTPPPASTATHKTAWRAPSTAVCANSPRISSWHRCRWASGSGLSAVVDPVSGGRRANYDRTLRRPALHRAFPGRPRREVQRKLNSLRQLRNRIAHHEPIFDRQPTGFRPPKPCPPYGVSAIALQIELGLSHPCISGMQCQNCKDDISSDISACS